MENIIINTSQNVNIETQRAGIGDRLIAFIFDYLILLGFFILTSITVEWLNIGKTGHIFVLISIIFFFYHFLSEVFLNGQSIGKIFRKLKVVNINAERASILQYFIRALFRPIDSIFGLGMLVIIVSKNSQRLGDLAAGTIVIQLKPTIKYSETVFADIEENYKASFDKLAIKRLSDKDIELIKLVIKKNAQRFRIRNCKINV